jgi:hypothetical protein
MQQLTLDKWSIQFAGPTMIPIAAHKVLTVLQYLSFARATAKTNAILRKHKNSVEPHGLGEQMKYNDAESAEIR